MSESSESSESSDEAVEFLDPLTRVYRRIWSLLFAYAPLAEMVRFGNRVRMDEGDPAIKDQARHADLPELILHQGAFEFRPFATNHVASFQQAYLISLTHADLRIDTMNAVKWAVLTAMSKADPHLHVLPSDLFGDPVIGKFVDSWRIESGMDSASQQALGDENLNRGRQRWTTAAVIQVQMRWPMGAFVAAE
jgi:hypothetical protein